MFSMQNFEAAMVSSNFIILPFLVILQSQLVTGHLFVSLHPTRPTSSSLIKSLLPTLLADGPRIVLTFGGFLGFEVVHCVLITGRSFVGYSSGQRHLPAAETKWSLQTYSARIQRQFFSF